MTACAACGVTTPVDGARFCHSCGAPLDATCAQCGTDLVPGARFCSACGAPQGAAPPPATPDAGVPRVEAERRTTSILFGDLVGYTSVAEGLDQEDARELLSTFFQGCRQIVQRYGGTVEKFIGDAVMAVWGVPTAHEDDAERAVRAGLELTRMVGDLAADASGALSMRVGIVTGEVAVTLGAADQGMVAGDPVNTASRIQSLASPGEVWVDQSTRGLTSAAISYADAGLHELKGKSEAVPLWVARTVVGSVRGGQRADGLEAPFVGRDRELRVVKETLHSTYDNRRPSLLVVDGDPGMGKTRLGWELFKYTDGLPAKTLWHQGRCVAYGDGVAFWALAEAVRVRLARTVPDDAVEPEDRIDRGLAELVPDEEERAWIRPRLAALLGSGSVGSYAREDLFSAWVTFFERVGDGEQLVLLIDDAQHADEGLLSFIEHLLASATFPCLVLLLTRPGLLEAHPALATNRRATVLHLPPLGDADMEVLVDGLVSGLPREMLGALVERSEGTPLYAVETVRSLIDRDVVVPKDGEYALVEGTELDLSVIGPPASLQALVAARLDALPPEERFVVGQASILGPTFSADALARLCPDIDTDAVLASLVRSEVLAKDTNRLSSEFGQHRFVQLVVRQIAYATLSRRDRKAGHLAVARHFESLEERSGDLDSIIAQHYLDAIEASPSDEDVPDLEAQAAALLTSAAHRAQALGAPNEAAGYLRVALERTTDADRRAHLKSELALVLDALGDWRLASTVAHEAMEHFDEVGDDLAAATAAARCAWSLGRIGTEPDVLDLTLPRLEALRDRPDAERQVLQLVRSTLAIQHQTGNRSAEMENMALRLADRLGDPEALADAYTSLAITYGGVGALSLSRVLFVAAADVAREHHLPLTLAKSLSNLTSDLTAWDLAKAVECGWEAVEAARRTGSTIWRDYTAVNQGMALLNAGRWDEARTLITAAHELADDGARPLLRSLLLAMARATAEEVPAEVAPAPTEDIARLAWESLHSVLELSRAGALTPADLSGAVDACGAFIDLVGTTDDTVTIWPLLMELAFEIDDRDIAARLVTLLDSAGMLLPVGLQGHRQALVARLAMGESQADVDIEADLRAAIATFAEWGGGPHLARAEHHLGRWLLQHGRVEEGEALLASARGTYRELGAEAWLAELDQASLAR